MTKTKFAQAMEKLVNRVADVNDLPKPKVRDWLLSNLQEEEENGTMAQGLDAAYPPTNFES